jgi:hypothetical protein
MNKTTIVHLRIDNETIEAIRKLALFDYRTINAQILKMLHEQIKQGMKTNEQ